MLLSVGFTKKPRQPLRVAINPTVANVNSIAFRLELEIIKSLEKPFCRR